MLVALEKKKKTTKNNGYAKPIQVKGCHTIRTIYRKKLAIWLGDVDITYILTPLTP
jgi:hypothetical protein